MRAAISLLVASLIVAGCGFLPSPTPDWAQCHPNGALSCTTVDGVALGQFVLHSDADMPACGVDCGLPGQVARVALETRAPDHPTLTSIDEYAPDRHALCGDTLCVVSGYLGIFVFTFSDSTAESVVVSCPGIAACRVIEGYGPSAIRRDSQLIAG
jgi:hypothetical protein